MPLDQTALEITQEDAFNWLTELLRERLTKPGGVRDSRVDYGYDIYIPNIVQDFLRSKGAYPGHDDRLGSPEANKLFPPMLSAVWELCLRGVLRPSWSGYNNQPAAGGGFGYSYTESGRKWLLDGSSKHLLSSTGRMGELLNQYTVRFGAGYYERSQEAVNSFRGRCYLACCTMCGAAAESILLALSIAKKGDEEAILKMYESAGGRSKLEQYLLGAQNQHMRNEMSSGLNILKHWRDTAAHGQSSNISETEANIALLLLWKFAEVSDRHWRELTGSP